MNWHDRWEAVGRPAYRWHPNRADVHRRLGWLWSYQRSGIPTHEALRLAQEAVAREQATAARRAR